MRNISVKTHILCLITFFTSENRSLCDMRKNIVELGRPQMTIRRMRIACWITKTTDTHSEYVVVIAFPLQQWLHERASALRCTYIGCLVYRICIFVTNFMFDFAYDAVQSVIS